MNIGLILDMAASEFPDRVMIGRRTDGITAARLRDLAQAGAVEIRRHGCRALVYLGTNGPSFAVALFAAAYAAVPVIPLNYRSDDESLEELVAKHEDAYAISARPDLVTQARRSVMPEEWLWTCRQAVAADEAYLDDAVLNDADTENPDQAAVILYTSGTTAAPKGVLLEHQNLMSYILNTVEFAASSEDDAALVSLPPYHVAAVANTLTNLYTGRRVLVLESFTPQQWVAEVQQEAITNALIVPTMLSRLVEMDELSLPSLKTLSYGGAPMPSSLLEQAIGLLPQVDFVNAYGLTETSSTITLLTPQDHREAAASADPAVRRRLGSVGRTVPGVDIEVRGSDGTRLAPMFSGRIWVRGDQVSGRYAESGSVLDDDGYFDTRDRGYLDEDGYLFIEGRDDDTIIRGGENVAPAEIEDVLLMHEAVDDAVVVGVPDVEWGNRIEAMVVVRPGQSVDMEGLRGFVREKLRGSKTPDRIIAVDEIPRTDTGKLLRREARKKLMVQ